jgi:hypothetical protein
MDTVFFTPEQRPGLPGDAKSGDLDLMNSATKPIKRTLIETASAANADELGESMIDTTVQTASIEGTGAWDAYDVWRRFIKEARDRRKAPGQN